MPDPMSPFGLALLEYLHGTREVPLVLERDDGRLEELAPSRFFRWPRDFSPLEIRALAACSGRVLDVGAGAGQHALALQEKGLAVAALDLCPQAVAVMQQRGIKDVRTGDIYELIAPDAFDTLLLLGRSVGLAGDLAGLRRLLLAAHGLLADGGQIILDSLDVTKTDNPSHLEYQKSNIAHGRYPGEIRLRLHYRNLSGDWYSWLLVTPETLVETALDLGWRVEIILAEGAEYVARLSDLSTP